MAKISTSTNIDWVQVEEQGSNPATPASTFGRIYAKSDGLYFIGDGGTAIGPLTAAYTEGARAYHDAAQAITTVTATALSLNQERYDTDTMHDTVTNNSRMTIQTAGKYLLVGNVRWAANDTGYRQTYFYLNATTNIGASRIQAVTGTQITIQTISTIYDFSASDYIELYVIQNSGGNLNVDTNGNYTPEFMAQRIG